MNNEKIRNIIATRSDIFNPHLNRESGLIFTRLRKFCSDVLYIITEGTEKSYFTFKQLHTKIIERGGKTDILSQYLMSYIIIFAHKSPDNSLTHFSIKT